MTTMKGSLVRVRPWIVAISIVLAPSALAQTSGDVAGRSDMRLWSFGNCERKYPRPDTEEYKECMRVVGSAEAKDLRAQRSCEDSFAPDQVGIDRCLSAYRLTKEGPAPANVASAAPALAALSPEMTLKVKAIASAAVEEQHQAAKEAAPVEAATPRAAAPLRSLVLVGALAIVLLFVGGTILLRRPA